MNERELNAKILGIQSEHFARMGRELAPYLDQLRALQGARATPPTIGYPHYDQCHENWGQAVPSSYPNMRAMTEQEKKEYDAKDYSRYGRGGWFWSLFGF